MNTIEEEFDSNDKRGAWASVYQKIRQDSFLQQQQDFTVTDAKRAAFKGRNRYRDVSPYDHSRVRLERDEIDYINASLVEYPLANRSYILTQGPLPNTSGHFWLMVWEQNTAAVLMLNRVMEMGRVKCHQYFPMSSENEDEDEIVFDDVGLKVSFVSEEKANNYVIRTLEIEDLESEERKRVLQFHYTTWPDFGVPESPEEFLDFLFAVRTAGVLEKTVGPSVIHCSAGIGRSGTFCLVDTCLILLEKSQDPDSVDVCEVLMEMRQSRMGLIQTPDQLRFSYSAIIEGCKHVLHPSSVDSGIDDNNLCQSSSSGSSSVPVDLQLGEVTEALSNSVPHTPNSAPSTPPPLPPRFMPPTDNNNPAKQTNSDANDLLNTCASSHTDNTDFFMSPHQSHMAGHDAGHVGNGRAKRGLDEDEGISNEHILVEDFLNMDTIRQRGQESTDIRRRNREERKKRTAEQIARMKKKQEECEHWQERKQHITPYIWGISLAVLVGSYIMYRYYAT